jgi:predicted flap endonuclease-1-like 5' DNA nuclease
MRYEMLQPAQAQQARFLRSPSQPQQEYVIADANQVSTQSRFRSEGSLQADQIACLYQELGEVKEQSRCYEDRLQMLQVEVEALKLYLEQQLATPTMVSNADQAEPSKSPELTIYDPQLENYDADWATIDPDLGVILAKRPEDWDDLTRIWGIGAINQERLNENGVYCFRQIAQWTNHNVEKFNALLSFKGRIERENWIGQAKRFVEQIERRRAA